LPVCRSSTSSTPAASPRTPSVSRSLLKFCRPFVGGRYRRVSLVTWR
jgi:hypothetical protein